MSRADRAARCEHGDTVLFGKWSGTEVKIDGQELLIMKESDIMGVLEAGPDEGRGLALAVSSVAYSS